MCIQRRSLVFWVLLCLLSYSSYGVESSSVVQTKVTKTIGGYIGEGAGKVMVRPTIVPSLIEAGNGIIGDDTYWNGNNESERKGTTNVTPTTPLKDTTISIRGRIEIDELQFLSACIAEFCIARYFAITYFQPSYSSQPLGRHFKLYTFLSPLITSVDVWLVGMLSKQKGSFKNSLIGAGVGTMFGIISFYNTLLFGPVSIVGVFIFPPLGATIGYNWK